VQQQQFGLVPFADSDSVLQGLFGIVREIRGVDNLLYLNHKLRSLKERSRFAGGLSISVRGWKIKGKGAHRTRKKRDAALGGISL
jgi:hypothetical protein